MQRMKPFTDVQIMGWFYPIAMPMVLGATIKNWVRPRMRRPDNEDVPAVDHDWLRVEWCHACQNETDHEYVQWKDEPVVTRTCLECEELSTFWDMV